VSSQQIIVEPGPDTPIQVAAATIISPLEAEVDHMATMLEKLVAVLARANPTEPTQGPLRPRVEAPRPTALCWECGERGHLRANCPQSRKGLNSHGPRTPPNPAAGNEGFQRRKTQVIRTDIASRLSRVAGTSSDQSTSVVTGPICPATH